MSEALQSQWAKLAGYIVGYQATWISDIGLKTGLFQAIADGDAPSRRLLLRQGPGNRVLIRADPRA